MSADKLLALFILIPMAAFFAYCWLYLPLWALFHLSGKAWTFWQGKRIGWHQLDADARARQGVSCRD